MAAAEDMVKKFGDAMNKHDLNALMACWAPDAVIIDPASPQPIKGKEAVRQNMDAWLKAFPDLQFKPSNTILSKGDTIAFEVNLSGTHKGPLVGPQGTVPASNKKLQFTGVGFWRMNAQGLIAEERRYYDTAGFMRQLGIGS